MFNSPDLTINIIISEKHIVGNHGNAHGYWKYQVHSNAM